MANCQNKQMANCQANKRANCLSPISPPPCRIYNLSLVSSIPPK